MILGFRQPKPHMQFCFAEWRKVVSHGRKPTKSTGLEEHMLIDPPLMAKILIRRKKQPRQILVCPVGIFKRTLVPTKMTMIPMDVRIYMSAASVIPRAKRLPTHLRTAGKQKTRGALQKFSALQC